MKVTQELVTVLADPLAGEISIVLAGVRIALSSDEAAELAHALATGLERLLAAPPDGAALEAWKVGRSDASGRPAEPDYMQDRTRALIQARMREKGVRPDETP
jgi:hypothetical protein